MATIFGPQSHIDMPRTLTQKVCIGMGIFFILAGLGGIVMPGLMGFHLSLAHNFIHLVSGVLAIWAGYSDNYRRAYNFCLGFGAIYGLLGVSGFAFGEPGFPGVGHMEADQNLLRIIPNALELGTNDHLLHIFLGAVFIGSGLVWKRKHDLATRNIIEHQARVTRADVFTRDADELTNSESDLRDADLGRSDIDRRSDLGRREDFERRI